MVTVKVEIDVDTDNAAVAQRNVHTFLLNILPNRWPVRVIRTTIHTDHTKPGYE